MENPQSLEEVLHELEWLIKSEADVKSTTSNNSTTSQNPDIDFDEKIYNDDLSEKIL